MKKLQKKIFVKGTINVKTGLYIGGTNEQMGIGGLDNLIIRNPLTQLPIIPGSSLKGKMRALLELTKGAYNQSSGKNLGGVGNDPEITALFGSSSGNNSDNNHASRLIVRDAVLTNTDDDSWNNTDLPYSEAKTEVVINRLSAKATPRTFERLPAGALFDFEMVVNIISTDEEVFDVEKKLLNLLSEGMQLLQDDYLGGQGSRGYGQIAFQNVVINEKKYDNFEENYQVVDNKDILSLFEPFLKK